MIEKFIGIGLIVIEQPDAYAAKIIVLPRREPDPLGRTDSGRIQNLDRFVIHVFGSDIFRRFEQFERLEHFEGVAVILCPEQGESRC